MTGLMEIVPTDFSNQDIHTYKNKHKYTHTAHTYTHIKHTHTHTHKAHTYTHI